MPGYHLPYLGGLANGLFAAHGLDVEILEPAPGPANVERVASGAVEFCLTSVSHFMRAQARTPLPARYVAMVVQRSPMAGLVAGDSPWQEPADLAQARLGGDEDNELVVQYQAGLRERGIPSSPMVPTAYGLAAARLGRGEVDVLADYVDLLPRHRRDAGIELRAIAVGPEVYSSGLVAGDGVSHDLASTMRVALAAALQCQHQDPEWAIPALEARYPEIDPRDAREGWALAVPNIFTGVAPGTMDAGRWSYTLDHLAKAYFVASLPAEAVYREEFLGSTPVAR